MVARGTPNAEAVGSSPITVVDRKCFLRIFIFYEQKRQKETFHEIILRMRFTESHNSKRPPHHCSRIIRLSPLL